MSCNETVWNLTLCSKYSWIWAQHISMRTVLNRKLGYVRVHSLTLYWHKNWRGTSAAQTNSRSWLFQQLVCSCQPEHTRKQVAFFAFFLRLQNGMKGTTAVQTSGTAHFSRSLCWSRDTEGYEQTLFQRHEPTSPIIPLTLTLGPSDSGGVEWLLGERRGGNSSKMYLTGEQTRLSTECFG